MDSAWLLVVMGVVMGATSAVLLAALPALKVMAASSAGRYLSLDALRGLLASGVLMHHAAIARRYFSNGEWVTPASQLYHFLGNGSVALFFMITGLLFWGKAIDGRVQPLALLRSRARRIMPLYLFSVALIVAVCLAKTGFELQVSAAAFVRSMLRWLAGGLGGKPFINGVETITVNAGVTWTLQYEWVFYLLLPLLAVCAPPRRFVALLAFYLATVAFMKLDNHRTALSALLIALPFAGGMIAAYVVRRRPAVEGVNHPFVTLAVLASLVAVICLYVPEHADALHMALTPAFIAIALGNDLFGVLRWRWVRWLGHISFSVYLLHGLVLLACLTLLNGRWPIAQWNDATYIAVCSAIGALVVLLSSLTYLAIERPFIETRVAPVRPAVSVS